MSPQTLSATKQNELLLILKTRFEKNTIRHKKINWDNVQKKLEGNAKKLFTLAEMERTGGEPDVVGFDKKTNEYIFYDCSVESPKGRRSYCYDSEALYARKEFKPKSSAVEAAAAIGIDLLTEQEYRQLQTVGRFDEATSSWIYSPPEIRKLGGAMFADRRYNHVFVFHNGADSYYTSRGFRGKLRV